MSKKIVFIATSIILLTCKSAYSLEPTPKNAQQKRNIENILNQDSDLWKKDSDKDGVPDVIEDIIKSDKYKKDSDNDGLEDKLELELNLNPTKTDSDDNNIEDGDEDFDNDGITNKKELELNRNPKINDKFIKKDMYRGQSTDITGEMLLESCRLSYDGIDNTQVGKTVSDVFKYKYSLLEDFTIVRTTGNVEGFSAIAIKKGDSLIVSYKATNDFKDWIGNFLTQFMPHPQRSASIEFIQPLIKPNDKVYITGHSLGGLLTQYTLYELCQKNITNVKAVTFNSANNMNPKHIKGECGPPIIKKDLMGYYALAYVDLFSENKEKISSKKELIEFFNKSMKEQGFIDVKNSKWQQEHFFEKCSENIENYVVKGDPLYLIINGGYLGSNIIKDCGYKNISIPNDIVSLDNAHKLDNFNDCKRLKNIVNIK